MVGVNLGVRLPSWTDGPNRKVSVEQFFFYFLHVVVLAIEGVGVFVGLLGVWDSVFSGDLSASGSQIAGRLVTATWWLAVSLGLLLATIHTWSF